MERIRLTKQPVRELSTGLGSVVGAVNPMDNEYFIHKLSLRIEELKRLFTIHQQTLERQVYINEVIEASLGSIECELILLTSDVKKGAT